MPLLFEFIIFFVHFTNNPAILSVLTVLEFFPVNRNKFKNQSLMTTTKLWRNGWIIGEKDKNYEKFKQKWHNNLPLDF